MNSKLPNKSLQGSCAGVYEQPVKLQASMPGDTKGRGLGTASQTFRNVSETKPGAGTRGTGRGIK